MTSRYLQYLPVPLQQGDLQENGFLGRFLLAFECLLTGLEGRTEPEGIEQKLDRIHTWFEPGKAPEDFLPWLASWVAVSLRDEWPLEAKRKFIQRAVSLHRIRGTPQGLKAMLDTFLEHLPEVGAVQVFEREAFPAHFFLVSLTLRDRTPARLNALEQLVHLLIEEQKPAHTFYGLEIKFPTMQISRVPEKRLTIGRNTILGTDKLKA